MLHVRRHARRIVAPIQAFIETEVSGGLLLLLAAAVAIVWANIPGDSSYASLFATDLSIHTGVISLNESLRGWINDGLMTVFFFVVGLEIKRELSRGELAARDKAILPIIAALGGMAAPALIYSAFNAGGSAGHGWGIPMATDIAFALGVLALLGRRLPSQLRVFLLTIAVVDDIGAIAVIAVFYSRDIDMAWLAAAAALVGVVYVMRRFTVKHYAAYLAIGCCLWLATFESGVTATISGVVLGLLTPLDASYRRQAEATESPLEHLERLVHPYASMLIVPLFALANAGVALSSSAIGDPLAKPVIVGIFLGCVIGKPLGIFTSSWLAVRSGYATLPSRTNWVQIFGVGLLGGLGFTVALFVNGLAFRDGIQTDDGKFAILAAAVLAGIVGYAFLWLFGGNEADSAREPTGR